MSGGKKLHIPFFLLRANKKRGEEKDDSYDSSYAHVLAIFDEQISIDEKEMSFKTDRRKQKKKLASFFYQVKSIQNLYLYVTECFVFD